MKKHIFCFMLFITSFLSGTLPLKSQDTVDIAKDVELYIIRPKKFSRGAVPMYIEINDIPVAKLKNNSYTKLKVSNGQIKINANMASAFGQRDNYYILNVDTFTNYFIKIIPLDIKVGFEVLDKEYAKAEIKKVGSRYIIASDTTILNDKSEVNDITVNRTDTEKEELESTTEGSLNMISTGIFNPSSLGTIWLGLGDFYLLEYERFFNQNNVSLSANINTSFGSFSSSTYWYNVGYGLTYRSYKSKLLSVGFGLNFLDLQAVNTDTNQEESLGIFLEPKIELLAPFRKEGINFRWAIETGYVLGDITSNGETEYIGSIGSNNFTFSLTFYLGIGW